MARRPQVRFFPSRNAFYCQIDGTQHKLADGPDDSLHQGPNFSAATKAYAQLICQGSIDKAGNDNTVATICNAYLSSVEANKRQETYRIRLSALRPFVDAYGTYKVSQVKPFHLEETIAKMRQPRQYKRYHKLLKWTDGTVRIFIVSVKAAFNWAYEQGLIDKVPLLKAVKMPTGHTKARERIVSPEEHTAILNTLRARRSLNLRRVVIALENTGARPGEITNAVAGDWNDQLGAIVYYGDDSRREDEFAHKTSGKGKNRTIRFTGEALEMVRSLVATKKKTDLLFPTKTGTSYGKNLMNCFKSIRERTGLSHVVPYSYRHTLATNWLLDGGSISILAELMGNTPATIQKHYSHLCQQHEAVRAQLEAFRQAK